MSENKQAAAQQGLKRMLVTLGVAALGCLVWLILGSIFSGIGVPTGHADLHIGFLQFRQRFASSRM